MFITISKQWGLSIKNSTVALDFTGNIVFNLKSELNFADNYLDFFEKEFKFVNSNSIISIKNILIELAENNKEMKEYFIEFERLRKYLISGMNVISDVNLAKFKLN